MIADMLTLILVLAPLFLMLYIGGLIAEQHDKKEESSAVTKQTEDSRNYLHPYDTPERGKMSSGDCNTGLWNTARESKNTLLRL